MFTVKTTLRDKKQNIYCEYVQLDGRGAKRLASDYLYKESTRPNVANVELYRIKDNEFEPKLVSRIVCS